MHKRIAIVLLIIIIPLVIGKCIYTTLNEDYHFILLTWFLGLVALCISAVIITALFLIIKWVITGETPFD